MHICQIIDGLTNDGAQRLIVYFARQATVNNDQVTVVHFSGRNSDVILNELREAGCRIHCSTTRRLYNPAWSMELAGFIRSIQTDIVQTHLSYANILGAISGRLAGIPVVSTLHTSNYKNQYYRPVIFRAEMAMLKYVSSGVAAVAEAVAGVYRPFLGLRTPAVFPNPVIAIPRLAEEERSRIRSQFLPRPEALLVISVGRLTAPKGYEDLMEAFRLAQKDCPDARLIIAGKGEEKDTLEGKIHADGLGGKVKLLGERTDVPALLAASDLFISASHWEGMPISILEAMSAGLPIIATRVGGVPEILEGRGVMVTPRKPHALAEAMSGLMNNPGEMQRMGLACQRYTREHHSPEVWYANLISYFLTFINNKNGAA